MTALSYVDIHVLSLAHNVFSLCIFSMKALNCYKVVESEQQSSQEN